MISLSANESRRWVLGLGLCLGLAAGCGLSSAVTDHSDASPATAFAPPAGTGDDSSGGGSTIEETFGAGGAGPLGFDFSALCGDVTECVPGVETGPGSCDASAAEGGGGATTTSPDGSDIACQVRIDPMSGSVASSCVPVGESTEPCIESADCAPGFGCVGTGNGICRPYCCGDLEACPADTYCAPQPLAAEDNESAVPVEIPVCVPQQPCMLLDGATCPEGTVCSIVRETGETSCVEAGEGLEGDPCPCAADHVCSAGENQCFRICDAARQGSCGEGYTCQSNSGSYPAGFGVCIET
ncbi:MAG: hypothetical protein AAGA56_20640 [Myxococcota bacterium]